MTIKAYPSKPVVAQALTISPLGNDISKLIDAITDLHEAYPAINDAGFSGYGTWSINGPTPIFGDETVGYTHALAAMGISLHDAKKAFDPILHKFQALNGSSLFVSVNWIEFPSYPAYYTAMSGQQLSVGTPNMAMTSHMFDKKALAGDRTALREMISTIAGSPEEMTLMSVELNGGGAVKKHDSLSGLNPAWRSTYMVEVVSRMWSSEADVTTIKTVTSDISYKKSFAMRKLSPFLGSYLNEADRSDPLWKTDFYGTTYLFPWSR
ncbi:hypothetical protein BDV59DRAFT_200826 [Aspergillus ambiguus]|uniref:uncharacterized protein n=1 Tax=Aspergillus ambiguus TaxID=176160 RepID=UPI003CCE1396